MTAAESSPGAGTARPASAVVAAAVVGGLALTAGTGDAIGVGVGLAAVAGGSLGGVVLCRARERPGWTAVASLSTPLVGGTGLAGVAHLAAARGALAPPDPLALLQAVGLALGVVLAALGAVGTLGDGIGEGAVSGVWRAATASVTVVTLAFGAVLADRRDALDALSVPGVGTGGLDPVLTPADPTVGLVSFAALVAAAAFAGRAALSTLPVAELAHRRRREAVRATVERADAALLEAAMYGALAAGGSVATVLPPVRETLPVAALAGLVASPALRGALLWTAVVAGGIALGGALLRAAAGETAATLGRLLPAVAGGVGVVLAATVVDGGTVRSLIAALPAGGRAPASALSTALSPTGLVLGVALVALVALTGLSTALVVASGVGLLPARGSGGVLAGTGLGSVAVLLGAGGASAPVVFALVGLAVVAWDVSDRGVGARAALGPRSDAGIEAVHTVGSVGVAAVGVGAAWGVSRVVEAVALPEGALLGAVTAVAAAVVLLGVLRG